MTSIFKRAGALFTGFLLYNSLLIAQQSDIVINEIMPLNESFRTDSDGEYSDWLELKNLTSSVFSMEGWTLTDDVEIPDKYMFPAINIPANGFLVVYASGKDTLYGLNECHTNFNMDADGEYLALFDASGNPVTVFDPFPPVKTNESYGYLGEELTMFALPSPGVENEETGAVLSEPTFSVQHGIYRDPFSLSIHADEVNVTIYYTLDGSVPSAVNGTVYAGPILINKTTIIRAVVTKGFRFPSEPVTQTYIFPEQVIRQDNSPEGFPDQWGPWTQSAGRAYADYEMDPDLMDDPVFAEDVVEGLKSIPTISLVSDPDNFFSMSTDPETGGIYMYPAPGENDIGRGWERPVSVEYFNADSTESFQVNCGITINGGESRRPEKNPKHSFRLIFRGEYGPSKLNYPIFEEPATTKFNRLILRGGFNNTWTHWGSDQRVRGQYMRDSWAKDTQKKMNHISGNTSYAHLYINGVYWGIYQPAERMDSDFAASYLPGSAEEFDVIKDYVEAADGNLDAWNAMIDASLAGFSSNEAYYAVQGLLPDGSSDPNGTALLDVENLADYMLLNLYGGNTDWDHHNWAATRNRTKPGRGFQFLAWDTEHIFESVGSNMVGENNAGCPSSLFQSLRQNEEFRRMFADRAQKFCFENGPLSPEGARETWDKRMNQVEPAIVAESSRWGDYRRDVHVYSSGPYELYTYSNHWMAERDRLFNDYFPQRTSILLSQLRSAGLYPNLDAPSFFINMSSYRSKIVNKGDVLRITVPEGQIYYTTDGTDPAVWGNTEDPGAISFFGLDADKKVVVPSADIGDEWKTSTGFDDSGWLTCTGTPGGVGYETGSGYENLISLDLKDYMYQDATNPNNSCYVRIRFNVDAADLEELGSLVLNMHYDDGFEAYLNGTKVQSVNAPSTVTWNSASSSGHEATDSPEAFNISEYISLLTEGENLLAIQGLNAKTSSSDFIINASLTGMEDFEVSVSPGAQLYTGTMSLDSSMRIKARTFMDGNWSALNDKYFIIPGDYKGLKITEVQYNPEPVDSVDDDNFEFIEIKNTGSGTLDLGGVKFADGIEYEFEPETQMSPGEFVVLASVTRSFIQKYGFEPFDDYKGRLNNGGEHIALLDPFGDTICSFTYDDDLPWPQYADGTGLSLVPVELNPAGDLKTPDQWRESYHRGGSPGEDDIKDTSTHVTTLTPETLFTFSEAYPNPFREFTYIDYALVENARVNISIYSMAGALVETLVDETLPAGEYQASWNVNTTSAYHVSPGIYLCRITVTTDRATWQDVRKLVLVR